MQMEETRQHSDLMNREEAAEYLRLSPRTLANWQCSGRKKVPCFKVGRLVFYRKPELEKWLELHAVNPV